MTPHRALCLAAVLCLALLACRSADPHGLDGLVESLRAACAQTDTGAIIGRIDRQYSDDRGGPGRLADDLRQLFTVYGPLRIETVDLRRQEELLTGHLRVEGRGLRFEGPLKWKLAEQPDALRLGGGFLTELRSLVWAMRERRLSLEQGNVERFGNLISLEYRGEVGGWKDLVERLKRDLTAMKGVGMMVKDLDLRVEGDEAWATQAYRLIMQIHGGAESKELKAKERLQLRREGSRWRIVGGLG